MSRRALLAAIAVITVLLAANSLAAGGTSGEKAGEKVVARVDLPALRH